MRNNRKSLESDLFVVDSTQGKKSTMKVAQRTVSSFCASINPSNGHQWNNISTVDKFEVRVTLQKCPDPSQPNGVVISAASTVWLPVPHQHVFNFLRDEGM